MVLILSSQYVNESIKYEVGSLPLSFVPIANKRIFYYQIYEKKKRQLTKWNRNIK
jgi:hypothetical protein